MPRPSGAAPAQCHGVELRDSAAGVTQAIDIAVLAAVSAPTALAVRVAQTRGQALVGFAGGAEFSVCAHGRRVAGP